MSGGWVGSNRQHTLPSDWAQRVAAVKKRSGGRCEWMANPAGGNYRRCHLLSDGGVDHFKRPDYHELDGLRDSCHRHHSKKSSREGNDAQAARKALRYRPKEEHPGRRTTP